MAIQITQPGLQPAQGISIDNRNRFGLNGAPAQSAPTASASIRDRFQASAAARPLPLIQKQGKVTRVITFGGLDDPILKQKPGLQMKVRGVMRLQHNGEPGRASGPINRLADSDWKDGQLLEFKLARNRISLFAPGFGPVGEVPPEIAKRVIDVIAADPKRFRFELSNMVAGTSKGAPTIGLRVNLVYTGADPRKQQEIRTAFNLVLNDPECMDTAMLYQEPTTPEQVLALILKHEKETKSPAAADQMQAIIDNIAAKIADKKTYPRILLIGHRKPDGDTLGCVSGLKNAIRLMDPTRQVDCAVDDKIPGLFRDKLPGINDIKQPTNPAKVREIDRMLADLRHRLAQPTAGDNPQTLRGRITALENEKQVLANPDNLLDPKAKYDLVVIMDTPTPTRFTDQFKPYLDQAKEVVYIDHHPFRFNEWDAAKEQTGLDMAKVQQNNLAWVADSVGACAEMMTILGNKLVPGLSRMSQGAPLAQAFPAQTQQQNLAGYVANLVTGMYTDTGSYSRTANLTPEDMKKPVEQRPNFQPEGVAKWLMNLTESMPGGRIDKKWLRENITYGMSDDAHERMLAHANAGKKVYPGLGFGVVQVNYEQMDDVWQTAMAEDGAVTLLDVQNEFKYGEVMSELKGGRYGKSDNIAVLICQDRKRGKPDENLMEAGHNGLRLSVRSANGTQYAELLASLFGGGGHGAAAGGRVDIPGIELDTPLAVKVNGTVTRDAALVLKTLQRNLAILHDGGLSDLEKKAAVTPTEVVADASGVPVADLMAELVTEIRRRNRSQNPTDPRR